MFNQSELYLLSKLLKKIKYSDLDTFEIDSFANSPITNSILQKINNQLSNNLHSGKIVFEFDSQLGDIFKERIQRMDNPSIASIASLYPEEIEKFAINILGPIDCKKKELDKLVSFIQNFVEEKTFRKVNLNSKSDNSKIKLLHQSIAISEEMDSDFWISMGYLDLKKQFLNFTEQDWADLKIDLINWNSAQLKILANSSNSLTEIFQLIEINHHILKLISQDNI